MSKVKSARGEIVDFDILKLKSDIAEIPISDDVSRREKYINLKRRRGTSRKVHDLIKQHAEILNGKTESKPILDAESGDNTQNELASKKVKLNRAPKNETDNDQ